jgi:hypothetical protein
LQPELADHELGAERLTWIVVPGRLWQLAQTPAKLAADLGTMRANFVFTAFQCK